MTPHNTIPLETTIYKSFYSSRNVVEYRRVGVIRDVRDGFLTGVTSNVITCNRRTATYDVK